MVKSAAPINPAAGTPIAALGSESLSEAQDRDTAWIQHTIFLASTNCPSRCKCRIVSSHLPALLQMVPLSADGDHLSQLNPDLDDDSPLALAVEFCLPLTASQIDAFTKTTCTVRKQKPMLFDALPVPPGGTVVHHKSTPAAVCYEAVPVWNTVVVLRTSTAAPPDGSSPGRQHAAILAPSPVKGTH